MTLTVFIITAAIIAAFSAFITKTVLVKKHKKECADRIFVAESAAYQKGFTAGSKPNYPVPSEPVEYEQDPNWDPPVY